MGKFLYSTDISWDVGISRFDGLFKLSRACGSITCSFLGALPWSRDETGLARLAGLSCEAVCNRRYASVY